MNDEVIPYEESLQQSTQCEEDDIVFSTDNPNNSIYNNSDNSSIPTKSDRSNENSSMLNVIHLDEPNETLLVAAGGRGGLGNIATSSSKFQTRRSLV